MTVELINADRQTQSSLSLLDGCAVSVDPGNAPKNGCCTSFTGSEHRHLAACCCEETSAGGLDGRHDTSSSYANERLGSRSKIAMPLRPPGWEFRQTCGHDYPDRHQLDDSVSLLSMVLTHEHR
jgi:hypothetical protein